MSPAEAEALGRRWIAAGGGWRTGMRSIDGWRILAIDMVIVCAADGSSDGADGVEVRECSAGLFAVPDLRDAATRGAALEVMRERLNEPTAHSTPDIIAGRVRWGIERANGSMLGVNGAWGHALVAIDEGSEAACLVAALEAAPKGGA